MSWTVSNCFCKWNTYSVMLIYSWNNEFKFGRVSLSDELREGKPISAGTHVKLANVRWLKKIHCSHLHNFINKILNNYLKVRKVCCETTSFWDKLAWIYNTYHLLTWYKHSFIARLVVNWKWFTGSCFRGSNYGGEFLHYEVMVTQKVAWNFQGVSSMLI